MTLREAWCFVMVLAFSRHMVVRVVFDQRIETWLQLHVEAFAELGGVVETVVPDNLKAAVLRAAFAIDDQSELNRSYRELTRHYGFKVDPTPPYDAQKKGKVEASVKYSRATSSSDGRSRTSKMCAAICDAGCTRSLAHASTAPREAAARTVRSVRASGAVRCGYRAQDTVYAARGQGPAGQSCRTAGPSAELQTASAD